MKLGFWKFKATAGIAIQGIGPYGMLNKSHHPNQFEYLSHMDPPYQR
jgi:hypothetical protein